VNLGVHLVRPGYPPGVGGRSEAKPSSRTQWDLTYLTRASTFPFDSGSAAAAVMGLKVVMSGQPDQVWVEDGETHHEVVGDRLGVVEHDLAADPPMASKQPARP
jgi:hypothetical protein